MASDSARTLLERLADAREGMSRSEAKVLDLVVTDPRQVVDSTMAAVAAAAQVSEPTVMRFSVRLGFDGYAQFRLALAEALALGLPAGFSTIGVDDGIDAISTKVFDHSISSLDRARRYLDAAVLDAVVETMLGSTSILFVGHGASAIIAADAAQKAVLFGVPCLAPEDPHQQFMAAVMGGPATVVVAISNTGATRSVVEVAQRAREAGAAVVAITGDDASPLAGAASNTILVKTFENTDVYTPTVSRLAGLVVVDILATAVSIRRGAEHAARLSEMKAELSQFRRG